MLGTLVSRAKTDELVEILLGEQTHVRSRNHVLDQGHIGTTWQTRWHYLCVRDVGNADCRYRYSSNLLAHILPSDFGMLLII